MEGVTTFRRQQPETREAISFFFTKPNDYDFQPGQFMFFTIDHPSPDGRGVRRHFTIASSPTEQEIFLTTKITDPGSSYKKALLALTPGAEIPFRGPHGEFTLPDSPDQPVVFLGGGIGITPFRSMIKFATYNKLPTPITLIYANKTANDIIYRQEFDEMSLKNDRLSLIYTVDSPEDSWEGEVGRLDGAMIKRHLSDLSSPLFYICGPQGMVDSYTQILTDLGINEHRIKTENFSGYE